ncbi:MULTISPECIES: RnfH family protein [unclassified Undibacterium]|uniref:RnfH family protein n=1 Tax=unclassified Undibacterium TaxID=2630295 RepID=UPI003C2E2237
MPENDTIRVQVCYSSGSAVSLLDVVVPLGASVGQAIDVSGIRDTHPELSHATYKTGVYGKLKDESAILHEGDRVEIYRPLLADPMEARRRRAKKQQKAAA